MIQKLTTNVDMIYLILYTITILLGFYLLQPKNNKKKKRLKLKDLNFTNFKEEQYNKIRRILSIFIFLNLLYPKINWIYMTLFSVIFFVSGPLCKINGETVFTIVYKKIHKKDYLKYNQEIYFQALQLRNMAKSLGVDTTSSLTIIENLSRSAELLKPIYSNMLSYWLIGDSKKACDIFHKNIGTDISKDFSSILSKLDLLTLEELLSQIDTFIEYSRETTNTIRFKKQEMLSNLLYIPLVAGVFVVMWNFVIVSLWSHLLNLGSLV